MEAGARRGRLHAFDHLRAAAIVAVVFTHAGRLRIGTSEWSLDQLLTGPWTRFHVPTFLFVSGYLYARSEPVGLGEVGRRLSRVLIPYLVASLLVQLTGLAAAHGPRDVVVQLLSAGSLGVYYYVFLIVCCIPLSWPLSRLGRPGTWLVLAAVLVATLAFAARPGWRPAESLYWTLRDPLQGFCLGFFVSGWLAALHAPELADAARRRPFALRALALGGAAVGLALGFVPLAGGSEVFARMLYSFGVIGSAALLLAARPAGPRTRLLGDAVLAIYLFHRIFQLLAEPLTAGATDARRILAQVALGLGGSIALVVAARRVLGPSRARRLLGA